MLCQGIKGQIRNLLDKFFTIFQQLSNVFNMATTQFLNIKNKEDERSW